MSRRNNNLAAKSLSDKQLMAALKRANPAKYGEGAPAEISAPKSAEATPVRTERESRALAEVMATAGCTVGLKDHSDPVKRSRDVKKMFTEAVGVKNEAIAEHLLAQITNAINHGQLSTEYERFLGAIALAQEIKPANINEALLATQMIAVHHAAMKFLYRATLEGQTFEGTDMNIARATRLMRLYTMQTEAMAKLRGTTGQQRMVVEHVNVAAGGQAIVGAIMAPTNGRRGGGYEKNEGSTPCKGFANSAVRSKNPSRRRVHGTGDEKRPLPSARRQVYRPAHSGRSSAKPERGYEAWQLFSGGKG